MLLRLLHAEACVGQSPCRGRALAFAALTPWQWTRPSRAQCLRCCGVDEPFARARLRCHRRVPGDSGGDTLPPKGQGRGGVFRQPCGLGGRAWPVWACGVCVAIHGEPSRELRLASRGDSLQRLSLGEALATVSVIHVAGTKGKARALRSVCRLHRPQPELSWPTPQGSTCAFTERILRSCGRRTGMFTSPHLMDVRERIQINGCVAPGVLERPHVGSPSPSVQSACGQGRLRAPLLALLRCAGGARCFIPVNAPRVAWPG